MALDLTRLSKSVAHALRHAPQEYGLQMDPAGWVNLGELVIALEKRGIRGVQEVDIVTMLEQAEKKRFQILDGRIRAFYGHTTAEKIIKERTLPPMELYHGTSKNVVDSIMVSGLKSMDRQYVHLSEDTETARIVGSRRPGEVVVLTIYALEAHNADIHFYGGDNGVWLSETIPAEFISI